MKSIKKNYLFNLGNQILTFVTPLITAPYLSRVLEADGIGTFSYIESICSYFALFAGLGLGLFGQREISYYQDNRKERTRVFWEVNVLEFISTAIWMIAYVVFSLQQDSPLFYLAISFNILIGITDISWLYRGMEEFGKIVFRSIVFKIINIASLFLFIKTKNDLLLYLFLTSFFGFINSLTYWISIKKLIDWPNWKELKPFRHMRVVLALFVPTIATQIYTVLDKTMIGIIASSAFENGYYEQAIKISRLVLSLITALGTVMIPRIGYCFNSGNQEAVKQYIYRGYRFVWFMGIPMCVGLAIVSKNFVPWFFGDGYEKVIPLIGILSLLIIAVGINNVTGVQYLIPTKRENKYTVTVVIGACTNLVLNCFLIYFLQSIGAAIASVVAETVIAIVQIVMVRKELSPITILKSAKNYVLAVIPMGIMLFVICDYFPATILSTAVLCLGGTGVYFVSLFLLKDEFFQMYLYEIICKLRSRFTKV